jgi:integrase
MGKKPVDAQFMEMLGQIPIAVLTTAGIRAWHKTLCETVSPYIARVAKKHLRSALGLAAEDFGVPVPTMPSRVGRGRPRTKKVILTPDQIGVLIRAAIQDEEKGVYYAFPFLTGVRPSEQLAIQWEDIDLTTETIHIRRVRERDGSTTEVTKTEAGTRSIPLSPVLGAILRRWQPRCPIGSDGIRRVFPCLGTPRYGKHTKRGALYRTLTFGKRIGFPPFRHMGCPTLLLTAHDILS